MGFTSIALSGLRTATNELGVIGHNISNANTPGFKQSRSEMADVYFSSVAGMQIGDGVKLTGVTQDFSQGGATRTGRSLDMALSGDGFFMLRDPSGEAVTYSRAGDFNRDKNGYVVSSSGLRLQGFMANNGVISATRGDIQIPSAPLPAYPTSSVKVDMNINASEKQPAVPVFDRLDGNSYNSRTSVEIFDSLGVSHILATYYVKTPTDNVWDVHVEVDGNILASDTLTFDSNGAYQSAGPGLSGIAYNPGAGASGPQPLSLNFTTSTQFDSGKSPITVRSQAQDGYPAGSVTGIDIDNDGVVSARYSNGNLKPFAQVSVAVFKNPTGLLSEGSNQFSETLNSGQPIVGIENSTNKIQPGVLEDSNVDLTEQMVKLISAQRSFQINSKSISAGDVLMQTILNLD